MFFKKFVACALICGFVIDVLANNQKMKPFINLISEPNSEGYFKEGTEFKAQCVVFNGEPMWNFSKPQDQIKISDTYILHNKIKEIQFHLTPKHNKMVLMCSHSDSPDLMDQFIINVE
uniref:Fasciclin-3-like n=1 Tax=Drosophila rhopaloa TaxID=1041015 RepID=A0A6P4DXX0_DRORH